VYYRYDLAYTGPYYAWNQKGNGTTLYYWLGDMPYGTEVKLYVCPEKGGLIYNYKCGPAAFGYSGGII
jgi:hypothetical protein